ncbi:sensor histidine kinase [Archangium violaceum]|uniref:sensor histidine kinase n=1 Tax=Archangium violaceum TaxID=83451 RepID=UPI00194FF431|nr:sensor histidine kinase [Archangium violaceum]QRN98546.1 sensor histidine kinase [Archangium violaceum]
MKLTEDIKPVTYMKTRAAELLREEDRSRIFERFERAISASEASGLGLGLYIAREIAQAHGGDISVESRLGEGSTFTVSLPLAA